MGCSQNELKKEETTTYFFIRHTEKDLSNPKNKDPELTEEGKIRAQKWAKVFSEVKLDMVFSTDYTRTRNTAKPIAESQNLEIVLYDPGNLNDLDFQEKSKGKTCVIVGHSNTTPDFVNKIIGNKKYSSIDEKIYGKLFVITIQNDEIADLVLTID